MATGTEAFAIHSATNGGWARTSRTCQRRNWNVASRRRPRKHRSTHRENSQLPTSNSQGTRSLVSRFLGVGALEVGSFRESRAHRLKRRRLAMRVEHERQELGAAPFGFPLR